MKLLYPLFTSSVSAFVLPWTSSSSSSSSPQSIISAIEEKANEFSSKALPLFDHVPTIQSIDHAIEHDYSDLTIYQIISLSDHAKEFTKWVNKYPKVVELLNGTDTNKTLFVPVDSAFEKIPDHKEPSDEYIEQALRYHVGIGSYPAGRILFTHTIPSAYNESRLGGEPQRLRTSVGLSGVRVNVYSKVIAVNFKAKNGYIHAVDKILLPPSAVGPELAFLPTYFSTLLLAYEKTNFVDFVHDVPMVGSTVFAPSNKAWARLGPKANAFLFNTETGKKYLKALLKYQIVANTTLYSDEIYYGDETKDLRRTKDFHIELPTLLEKKSVGVDVHSWKGWVSIVVNGANAVSFQDGVAKNGVIQVVDSVPIPPCRRGRSSEGEISVEELKERVDGVEEMIVQDL